MTYKITVAGKKGGTKKTTTARALAVEFARAGWRVGVADFDISQSTFYNWAKLRKEAGHTPAIHCQKAVTVAQALHDLDGNYDIIIFDSGATASQITEDLAAVSDLVVLTTQTARDDVEATGRLALNLSKSGIDREKIAIAFYPAVDGLNELVKAKNYFDGFGFYIVPGCVRARQGYINALDSGLSITEATAPTLKRQAINVIEAIAEQMEKVTA